MCLQENEWAGSGVSQCLILPANTLSVHQCLSLPPCSPITWWDSKIATDGISLLVQWLRIQLPIQWLQVLSWWGKIPHAKGQQSLCHNYWSTTPRAHKLQLPSLCATTTDAHTLWSQGSATREDNTVRSLSPWPKSSPRSLQLDKAPPAATKTEHSQK